MTKNGSHSYTVLITPDIAREWLEVFPYKYQRPITKSAVKRWANEMSLGKWLPGTTLDIAVVDVTGKRYLINGYHRLSAVMDSGTDQQFTVVEHIAHNEQEVHEMYSLMDIHKKRTDMDSVRHLELGENYGLNLREGNALASAIRVIESRFMQVQSERFVPREMPNKVVKWAPYMSQYVQAIGDIPADVKSVMSRQVVVAVGVVTMKYCPGKAIPFWNGVCQDNEISITDPRKLVRRWLIANPTSASRSITRRTLDTHAYALYISTAWNNWFSEKPIAQLKVYDLRKEDLFEGVPYDYDR